MSRGDSWRETLALWQKYEYTGMKPGLERIRAFLRATGGPQENLKIVHIAGTNGKGSTAAILAEALKASGLKTALYTSPHLVRLNERIRVNGKAIEDAELGRLVREFERPARRHGLTFFEFITGIAFHCFSGVKTDIAVLETGLGGRFDATNVFPCPEVSVITGIGYDHQAILGSTLQDIAREKAGIIKKGRPVVSAVVQPAARGVIRGTAQRKGCLLREAGRDYSWRNVETAWEENFQRFRYRGRGWKTEARLSLLGEHQAANGATALAALEVLSESGWPVKYGAALRSLSRVRWPGRFDVRITGRGGNRRTLILDGAHNPQGMERFVSTFRKSVWSRGPGTVIFGALRDKEYRGMISLLAPVFQRVILVPVRSDRSVEISALQELWTRRNRACRVERAGSLKEAFSLAGTDRVVSVTGSLYLVGEALAGRSKRL